LSVGIKYSVRELFDAWPASKR